MISSIKKMLLSVFICSSCVYAQNYNDFDYQLLKILMPLKSILHEPQLSNNVKDKLEKPSSVVVHVRYKLIKDVSHNQICYEKIYSIDYDTIKNFIPENEEKFEKNEGGHLFIIAQEDNVVEIEVLTYKEQAMSLTGLISESFYSDIDNFKSDHDATFEWGTCNEKDEESFDRVSSILRRKNERTCKISLSKAEFQKYINELKK